MKNNNSDSNLINQITSKKDFGDNKIKTTNVNILLNRVKLDKRRSLKKKILLFLTLLTFISSLVIYLNI